jgi:hypothetical protein
MACYGVLSVVWHVTCKIPFQILTVLDRGLQIQSWPLRVILGKAYGYVMGSLIGIVFRYYERLDSEKQNGDCEKSKYTVRRHSS